VYVNGSPARPSRALASAPREQSVYHDLLVDENEANHGPRVVRPSTAHATPLGHMSRADRLLRTSHLF
jgi:hypothetical protein